jgi:hypothetical protein
MRARELFWLFCTTAFLVTASCSIANDDRCPSGYFWKDDYMSCLPIVDSGTDTDTDTDTDTGTDGDTDTENDGGSLDDSGAPKPGFGIECTDESACEDYLADYCIVSPLAPTEPGYCTVENCSASDCPDGWQCCDCTALTWVKACMDDENAATAASLKCTCEIG